MARGINRITILGHLEHDLKNKVITNGNIACNIAIATTEE